MPICKDSCLFCERLSQKNWGFSESPHGSMMDMTFETPTVAPRAGAWIETLRWRWRHDCCWWSLPVRERGLKHIQGGDRIKLLTVAPRAGAWIETSRQKHSHATPIVAPRAGAWIETPSVRLQQWITLSLPVRERGLKLCRLQLLSIRFCRSPCGSVD